MDEHIVTLEAMVSPHPASSCLTSLSAFLPKLSIVTNIFSAGGCLPTLALRKTHPPPLPRLPSPIIKSKGFPRDEAQRALEVTGGSVDRAIEWLFSSPEERARQTQPPSTSAASTLHEPFKCVLVVNKQLGMSQGGVVTFISQSPLTSPQVRFSRRRRRRLHSYES